MKFKSVLKLLVYYGSSMVLVVGFQNCGSEFQALDSGSESLGSNNPPTVSTGIGWTGSVTSTPNAAIPTIVVAPKLPSVTNASEVVAIRLQNNTASAMTARMVTLGQTFKQGQIATGFELVASASGQSAPVQMDVKNRYSDGSVRFAVLTLQQPALSANSYLDVMFKVKAQASAIPLPLSSLSDLNPTLTLSFNDGTNVAVNIAGALTTALAVAQKDLWLSGPLAQQIRVDIPIRSSLHVVIDLTAYADNTSSVDFQINNDIAMSNQGGKLVYDAQLNFKGQSLTFSNLQHYQYGQWRQVMTSNPAPSAHVQHDVRHLVATKAVLPYNIDLGAGRSQIESFASQMNSTTWGKPFATNGVETNMPMVGGRGDIGPLTQWNAIWLVSQDERAAKYALGQADAAAAIPWHFWDAANKQWLNVDRYPGVWTDPRGGNGPPGGLTQQVGSNPWSPEDSHNPNLSYLAYLFKGARYHLDQQNAEASWAIMFRWPDTRIGKGIVIRWHQVRGAAWCMREIHHASRINPDGTYHHEYFNRILNNNLDWLINETKTWTTAEGETQGYVIGEYGVPRNMAPWQQDYMASTMSLIALQGNAKAMTYMTWASNFLVERFLSEAKGFNPRDGVAYNITYTDTSGSAYKTWAGMGSATVATGASNGNGWSASAGVYGQLGFMSLALVHATTGNPRAIIAYNLLKSLNPPYTDDAAFRSDAVFSMVPPK